MRFDTLLDWLFCSADTRELARLNRIWEAFNDKKLSPEQTMQALGAKTWKYHKDKVELLHGICEALKEYDVEV